MSTTDKCLLVKIKRQYCLNKYQQFPTRVYDKAIKDYIEFYPEPYSYYVITSGHKTFKGRINHLGIEISKIAKKVGYDNLIFLGNEDIPWLHRDSDFKPAKAALNYLIQNKVGKRFNGALQVDPSQIPVFVKHLAWLTRCNTVLPYVYFTDQGHNIIGHICQYGNLHINILNSKIEEILNHCLESSRLELLVTAHCS